MIDKKAEISIGLNEKTAQLHPFCFHSFTLLELIFFFLISGVGHLHFSLLVHAKPSNMASNLNVDVEKRCYR